MIGGNDSERGYLVENLATLFSFRHDLTGSLRALEEEARSSRLRRRIRSLREDIEGGSSLASAMEKAGLLPTHFVALLRIGEQTGKLPQNFRILARQSERERALRDRIRSAMLYPGLVLFISATVGLGIAWFILPRLATVFLQLHVELPLLTRGILAAGEFLGRHGAWAVPLAAAILAVAVYLIFIHPRTRFLGEKILFSLPGIRVLLEQTEVSRFGNLLGTLLGAGIPITDALGAISSATPYERYRKCYVILQEEIEAGESFSRCFADSRKMKVIPVSVQQMIVAGERSGQLPQVLLKIGRVFDGKLEATAKNLSVVLEPVLLFIVWIGVVAVALAVILPLYSLIGGLG